jgi:hypothetical protein
LDLKQYGSLRIDVALLALLLVIGLFLVLVRSQGRSASLSGIKDGASAVLTAAAFLLPLTLLGIPFIAQANPKVSGGTPRVASVDLFVAVVWLAVSTILGLAVIASIALRGSDIAQGPTSRDAPSNLPTARSWLMFLFWAQVAFEGVGLFRLLWGFGSLTTFILRKFG